MGNKQVELETIVQQDGYDIVAITEIWWDGSHEWSTAIDGYKLFRRNRLGGEVRGGGRGRVALYIRACSDCLEIGNGNDRV